MVREKRASGRVARRRSVLRGGETRDPEAIRTHGRVCGLLSVEQGPLVTRVGAGVREERRVGLARVQRGVV